MWLPWGERLVGRASESRSARAWGWQWAPEWMSARVKGWLLAQARASARAWLWRWATE